mgnify:CR=1 FL=1
MENTGNAWDNYEKVIELDYKRNEASGEFEVEIVSSQEVFKETFELQENNPYLSIPAEGKFAYSFVITSKGLNYFKLPKAELDANKVDKFSKIEFHMEFGNEKTITKKVVKLLDRAEVKSNGVLYRTLHNLVAKGE